MSLNTDKLFSTGLSALGIISGVVIKNTAKKLETKGCEKTVGTGLFIAGWAGMAYSLKGSTWKSFKSLLAYIAIIFIVIAVMVMVTAMETGKEVPMIMPVIFAMGWLVLGLSLSILRDGRFDKWNATAGATASLMVILSMLVVIPWQRENCIVDGPGYPLMFGLAFAIFTLVNSLDGGLSTIM